MEERYRSTDRVWSGKPNSTLVDYAAELAPGSALDIGCGEGADALWLKNHGWDVLGIDFAPTAVARTRALGVAAQVAMFSGFSHEPFELVSVHYGGIRATSEEVEKLEHLVAPGGTLLFVHHDMESTELAMPEWLAHNLRELETVTLARWERHLAEGAGAHHRTDVVLVAKRVG
ncbi:MAG: methyltransferase domain-containing protein [Corynebacterium sp.]|uniref:class I SAM-dependent methyltransferase n=1 Tax=Corynebacterium sp. TaxID=1720 RepID=UPI00280A5E08|nr:methyltransferase domain-containing protein [Corynebacterium sp.]MDU3165836.1 methyltransferase domain-containing protein [Corynebacterium sp.]MDU4632549.1 methyltransferase domain-containing protein [Corynebacterium sp.]MDU5328840.1 methyltransferase domain-containing protein [Corynebacterium sp.]MDU6418649.1 methyltransferase domain-containing protein [Corynebacterium sp.]MDU6592098.1 methyltransferase domain-containing protein [Corynebacterium sp.]